MENELIKNGAVLTKADLARVAAVIEQPTAENTGAAYRKDLVCFWAWAAASLGLEPGYPVAVEVVVEGPWRRTSTRPWWTLASNSALGRTAYRRSRAGSPRCRQPTGSRVSNSRTTTSSGGRRRSEVAAARVEHLSKAKDGYLYRLGSSKTDQDAKG